MTDLQKQNEIKSILEKNAKEDDSLDLSKIDDKTINNEYKLQCNQWTYEIWDKKCDINGVDASEVKKHEQIEDDASVFIIRNNGKVVVFQSFEPHVQGYNKMDDNKAISHASRLTQEIITENVCMSLLDKMKA